MVIKVDKCWVEIYTGKSNYGRIILELFQRVKKTSH
jgi:hypothetical protein